MSPDRPPRVSGFSYVGLHQYFLTICTAARQPSFEEDESASWLCEQILKAFEPLQFAVVAFCVMPDHVHLLLEGLRDDADLRMAVHNWKLRTGFAWKQRSGRRLWQEGYFDYVLRDEDQVVDIVKYILNNPLRAKLVDDPTKYPYVGSTRYPLSELVDTVSDWEPPYKRRRSRRV
ncbi:MAG TPA: transposase [Vicinamibacterales bacterium]